MDNSKYKNIVEDVQKKQAEWRKELNENGTISKSSVILEKERKEKEERKNRINSSKYANVLNDIEAEKRKKSSLVQGMDYFSDTQTDTQPNQVAEVEQSGKDETSAKDDTSHGIKNTTSFFKTELPEINPTATKTDSSKTIVQKNPLLIDTSANKTSTSPTQAFDNKLLSNFNSDYIEDAINYDKDDTLKGTYEYIRDSGKNAFQGGMEDLITGTNAIGAGVLGDIQLLKKAIEGDEESKEKVVDNAKSVFEYWKYNIENPYAESEYEKSWKNRFRQHLSDKDFWGVLGDLISYTPGAINDALVSSLSPTAKEKYIEYMNTYGMSDATAQIQSEIEEEHPAQSAKGEWSPTQITKNVVTNINNNLPSMLMSASGLPGGSAVTLGVQSMPGAYRDAKADGATDEQALSYAILESINQGFGDTLLGGVSGVGKGIVSNQTAKVAAKLAKSPLAKTAIQTGLTMLEEGGQEFVQSYITTLNKQIAYDSDEEFDIKGATYEGVLGSINALVLSPLSPYMNYNINKTNYDIVNSISSAASKVESETDINALKKASEEIIAEANSIINSKNSEDVDKANATYVVSGLQEVVEQLDKNGTTIIEGNKNSQQIMSDFVSGAKEINADTITELVENISKSNLSNSGNKAVRATVNYLNTIVRDNRQNVNAAENVLSKKVDDLTKQGLTQEQLTSLAKEAQAVKEQSQHIIEIAKQASEVTRANKKDIAKIVDLNSGENKSDLSSRTEQSSEINTEAQKSDATDSTANVTETEATAETHNDIVDGEEKGTATNQYETYNTSDNISEDSYNSDVSQEIRNEFGGKTIKETAENIIKSYGNVRNAVDYVHKIYSEQGNNSDSNSKAFLKSLDAEIRTTNKEYLENSIKKLSNVMKQYGIKNIEIDESITPLSSSGNHAWGQAHYNRDTGKIYVSPYADTDAIIGSKIVHEFTHHGATADTSLVSDILEAAKKSTSFNKEVKLSDGGATTTLENLSNLIRKSYANEINEHIAVSKNLARYTALLKEGKSQTEAAKIAAEEFKANNSEQYAEIVSSYIDEETAAYVMEQLNSDQNLLRQLINDNRPLWKRILEKLKDFIANLTGKGEARQYQKAADKIRAILEEEINSDVENSSDFKDIQSKVKEHNEKIGNTADGRRFSMELDVDESNSLFAIHNLSESNFMKSYNLGGLAMPSIAIAKADVGHTNFGDISLVFSPDTINPEQNTANKVYSADAWTPTFPKVEYEANAKVADKIRDKYYKLYKEYGRDNLDALYPYGNYFEEQLNSDGGVDGIIEKQSDNPKMMQVYLLDTKGEPVETVYKETTKTLPAEQVEQSQFLVDRLGSETILTLRPQTGESPAKARKRWFTEHGDDFKSAYAEYLTQAGLTTEEATAAIDNMTQYQLVSEINKARNYIQNGSETTEKTPDIEATNNAIREVTDKKQYTEWLHRLFDGGEKKTGISNGKDKYTNSGNLRSFSATHYPVTLDNIVLSMKQQGDGNSKNATSLFVGSKTIRAESATEYSSLDEIRADKSRLSHRTAEEAKATWNEFDTRLANIIDRIMDAESNIENRFMEQDRVGKILAEASRNNTEANIKKVLASHKLTTAVASDFKALVDDIKEAPVDIFEAKPERVVGFDEVKYAIIPDNASVELKNALNKAEIETKTYESGNDADRLKVLNTLSDVRFSKQFVDPDGNTKSENVTQTQQFKRWFGDWQNHSDKASKVVNEDGTPKVVYHGTDSEFWTFSLQNRGKNGEKLGVGYYFVDNKSSAESYGDRIVEAYLDIKKPASAEFMEISRKEWEKFLDYAIENREDYVDGVWKGNKINKTDELTEYDYGSTDAELIKYFINGVSGGSSDVAEAYLEMLKDSIGYDGIVYNAKNADYYVAFTPEQIKSATDNIGTFDKNNPDIRYSRELDIDGKEYIKVDDTVIDTSELDTIPEVLGDIVKKKSFANMVINGQSIGVAKRRGINEWYRSNDAMKLYRRNRDTYADKIQAFQNADELLTIAKNYVNEEAKHKNKYTDFARGQVRFMVGDNSYTADILVGIRPNKSAELYDIINIKKTKIVASTSTDTDANGSTGRQGNATISGSISQAVENVNNNAEDLTKIQYSNSDMRHSKEIMSAEEKRKLRESERSAYLERQLVESNKFGEKAKAVAPTEKNKIAKQMANGMPGVTTAQVNEQLKKFYSVVEHPKSTNKQAYAKEVQQAAKEVAQNLYDEFRVENVNPMYDEYKDTYNRIKSVKFKMTDATKADFGKSEYSDFYKRARGTLKLRVNDGIAVDEIWGELCDSYPHFFSQEIVNPSEQMERILEVQNSLKKVPGHPYYDVDDSNADVFSVDEDVHVVKSIADALIASYVDNAKTTIAAENKSLRNENERLTKEADTAKAKALEVEKTLEVTQKWNDAELKKIYSDFTKTLGDEQRKFESESKRADRLTKKIESSNVRAAQKVALKEISRLKSTFDNPTKKKHIPQEMRESVGAYLNVLNGTKLLNGSTINASEINETLDSEKSKISQTLSKLVAGLKSQEVSGVSTLSNRQIETLTKSLDALNRVSNETTVDESGNIDYIKTVTQITRLVNHCVAEANTFFTGEKKLEASRFSAEWKKELSGHKGRIGEIGDERPKIKKALDGVGYGYMSADLFFSTMGESGEKISSWYRKAQTRQVKMKQEYTEYMRTLLGDDYNSRAGSVESKKNLITVKLGGKEVKVSRNQLMSLYLTWNRPAGRQHLETGGVAFVNANNETNSVYAINKSIYDSLMSNLSSEDKRIADGIRKFLSSYCADWGNDASMQLYGIRLYEDTNYFPLRTPSELRDTNFSNTADTHTLENLSFTHQLNKNATSPVAIGDVFDIADKHVNDMSSYAAYAPLNSSMERIFNTEGLKRALNSAYGNDGVKYVQEFIDKVNGNSTKKGLGDNINKLLDFTSSNAKKAAVALNFSTALKQPLSIARASLVIDPKYLTEAYLKLPPIVNTISWKTGEYKRIFDTMNEYSGIAVIKSQGYSDTGIGESLRSTYDESSNSFASKADNAFMKPAEFADEITWVRLWKACELEAKDKYGNELSENEYIEHVTNRFNEIIGKTQVVDSFMDTAPVSNNRLFKTLYPFMNEPVKTTATLLTAAENIRNGKNDAKNQMVKAVGCFVVSNMILEPVVSSLVGMFRHDSADDPEEFAKKFVERFVGVKIGGNTSLLDVLSSNVVDGVFSTPFVGAVYSTVIDTLNGYDPQRLDLQPVSDLIGSLKYFFDSLDKEDYENQKTKLNYFTDTLSSVAQIFGVPTATIKRDLSAIVRNAVSMTNSYTAQWELNKLYYNLGNSNARANKNFYDIMSRAYKAGDTEAYSYMLEDLKATQTGAKAFGVSYKNINKYITENGAKIEVGSDMWYVSLQAEYLLDSFVPTMKVEKTVTDVYKKAKEAGLEDYEKAIYTAQTSASKFSVNGEDYEMTLEEFNTYTKGAGDFAYKITNALPSNYQWDNLNTEQKLYALEKTYEFSKAYWKKKINSDYSISTKWMNELYDSKVDFQKYARAIITQAKNK